MPGIADYYDVPPHLIAGNLAVQKRKERVFSWMSDIEVSATHSPVVADPVTLAVDVQLQLTRGDLRP